MKKTTGRIGANALLPTKQIDLLGVFTSSQYIISTTFHECENQLGHTYNKLVRKARVMLNIRVFETQVQKVWTY